jgi:hypothetical protein
MISSAPPETARRVSGRRGLRDLGRIYLRRRYGILFYTLLLTLVAAPLFSAFDVLATVIDGLLAVSLLAAVLPVDAMRRRRVVLVILLSLGLARPATAGFDHPALSAMALGAWTLVGLLAASAALRFAMGATEVDSEHLYAALGAYLLAGVFFGVLYWVLEQTWPGTFAGAEVSRVGALYFSFVTLATLGYGDIVPRTDVARGVAIIEGVGGQLFLAVLVARLVSLYSSRAPEAR